MPRRTYSVTYVVPVRVTQSVYARSIAEALEVTEEWDYSLVLMADGRLGPRDRGLYVEPREPDYDHPIVVEQSGI
jgi:hypothetical protein